MTSPSDLRPSLEAAIAALQSQRVVLGDALVDSALAPLLERLTTLGAQPEPTEPAAAADPGRRLRQVSVLFLDIVGSTQLIQHLDPEEVQATVDGALAAFTAIVTRHGGEVLRYAGDNLKAAFGAHDTAGNREDDAERAVHCGLALLAEAARRGDEVRRLHGFEGINARVGIHTGGVVRGGGIENDKSLSGLTVNIAARLEQAAPAGALRISQDTWALVRGLFDAQMQPPLAMKGVAAPITSWLVQGAKPRAFRLHARGIHGQETPLVGRQAELTRFEATLEALLAERTPRALTLVADAGLGKSRLLQEFQHILSAQPSRWWLMSARNQPSGALQPYGLLRDLLARRLEIADSDSADVARAKLVQGLAPWLGQSNDPAPELLGQLIGLDFSAAPAVQRLGGDARLLRDRALTALRLWLERLAASDGAPVVLLLDDLQWADDASLDALVALLKKARGPLLALLCARPGLIERVPDWGKGLPQHECLTLQPLDAAQGDALTRSLLHRLDPVPTELVELIGRRAEGNPFYAEELVGMLLDLGVIRSEVGNDVGKDVGRGVGKDGGNDNGRDNDSEAGGEGTGEWRFHPERLDPQRLPTTLTGVLQARLDALEPEARRALQMASVVGPVFWDDALGALDAGGPAALPALQRKSLVQQRPTSAFDDTAEEAFQHHLLHQVSYDTVLKPQKREAHARAAAWLTQRVGDRSDEFLGITAEHFARAGQCAPAADWFTRAASTALERFAFRAGLQYVELAEAQATLAAESWSDGRRFELLRHRLEASDNLALRDLQQQTIDHMLALGESQRNDAWLAETLSGLTLLEDGRGRREQAEAAARRGAEAAEAVDDPVSAALCHGNLAWMAIEQRQLDAARQHLAAGAHWAAKARERMRHPQHGMYEVQILLIQVELHTAENDEEARAAALGRALDIAATLHAPRLQCSCHGYVAKGAMGRAEPVGAAVHVDAIARLAAEFDLPRFAALSQSYRASLHLLQGQWNEASREAAAAAQASRAMGDTPAELEARQHQAEALWRGGRTHDAALVWEQAAEGLQQLGDDPGSRGVRLRLAEARAAGGEPQDVHAARQAVVAELPAMQGRDDLAGTPYGLAARLSGWRVLHRAGDPAAAGQLALAAAELEQVLNRFSDPEVRERVRNIVPWHRDVVEALAQSTAGA